MNTLHISDIIVLSVSLLSVVSVTILHILTLISIKKTKLQAAIDANEVIVHDSIPKATEKSSHLTLTSSKIYTDHDKKMALILETQHDSSYLDSLLEQLASCKEADDSKRLQERLMSYLVIQNSMYENIVRYNQVAFGFKMTEDPVHKSHTDNKPRKTQSFKAIWSKTSESLPGSFVYSYKPENLERLSKWTAEQNPIDDLTAENDSIEEYFAAVLKHSEYTEEQKKQVIDRLEKISTALAHQEQA